MFQNNLPKMTPTAMYSNAGRRSNGAFGYPRPSKRETFRMSLKALPGFYNKFKEHNFE